MRSASGETSAEIPPLHSNEDLPRFCVDHGRVLFRTDLQLSETRQAV